MILGLQRSGTTYVYDVLHKKYADGFSRERGNNMLNHVFRPMIKNPLLLTNEFKQNRYRMIVDALDAAPNAVIKQHCDFLKIFYKTDADIASKIISKMDFVYRLERRNKFEFTLSRIMWARTGQHGDSKQQYNMKTYPFVTLDENEVEAEMNRLIVGEQQLFIELAEYGVIPTETIFYEDFLKETPSGYSIKAPSKNVHILNYAELKDKFDRWS